MLAWKLFYSNGSQKKGLPSISISLVTKPGKIKELYIHTGLYKYALIQISVGKVKYSSLVLAVSFNCGRNETWR